MDFYKENHKEIYDMAENRIIPYLKKIESEYGQIAVVQEAYKLTDEKNEQSGLNEKVSCSKGCSFCCHSEILISRLEANYIKYQLKLPDNKNLRPNKKRLLSQNKVRDYNLLPWKNKACSFLQADGLCSIYAVRPMTCRTHNSIDVIEKCNKEKYPNSLIKQGYLIFTVAVMVALEIMDDEKDRTFIHKEFKNFS